MRTIMVSGGFDPIHVGHVRMILDAAKHGEVIVVANSDDWLMRKKGYVFMPWKERAEIIESIRGVVRVEHVDDTDNTVCEAISRCRPDAFANGGDRKGDNTPEVALCNELGIELMWNIGGGKIQSSSGLVKNSKAND
jgi:D-beta-D-heptose 7-phosphate kinase/D-beta-D-heptose 1-phosphate adenosyltransferase